MKPAPEWLAELQARFGGVLRTPLDRSTGTLRAVEPAADAIADAIDRPGARAIDRLAIYNRQYWFRLLSAMSSAYARTAALIGHWRFNEHAASFLVHNPPRGWDLDRVPDGFELFLERALPAEMEERELLLDAARIDAAWRTIARAPIPTPLRLSPEDAARLADTHLVPSPAVAIVVERWALMDAARVIEGRPPRHAEPRWWALVRWAEGHHAWPLEAREAELLALLREHRVRDALARLEARCDGRERAELPANARRWLARASERGFFAGLRE